MMDNAIQAFLHAHAQSDSPAASSNIPHPRPTCCCGSTDCLRLRHNQTALEDLERDVRTAAKLGQALLTRHESYVAESERERQRMAAQIEALELEKQVLEHNNAQAIDENRNLLDQLETLNNAVSESDDHVSGLQATLLSTQQEMHKLSQLAGRTERLERQLADLELEQATWHSTLEATAQSEKSAVQRWQRAERTLVDLEEQMVRIEHEAKEERERHLQVVARMERRHAVESELSGASGRLKGAAAAKTANETESQNVVSHFVKDILQDNATLQMGIVELREMLQTSNDEVENLRSQLVEHQPAPEERPPEDTSSITRKDLHEELTRASSQEYHIHHHYHAPSNTPKPPPTRRPRRKRYGTLVSGHSTPTSGYGTPRSSISYATPGSAATILDQTAVSVPQAILGLGHKRVSTQSSQSYYSTSVPGSPTTNRTSSIFERVFSDSGIDSSRPTTPETEDPGSPFLAPTGLGHSKRGSVGSFRTRSAPIVHRTGGNHTAIRPSLDSIADASIEQLPGLDQQLPGEVIPEEGEGDWENASSPGLEPDTAITSPFSDDLVTPLDGLDIYKPSLRRAASHESILSVSGLDIHTLKSRPSQLLTPYGGRSFTPQAAISGAHAHIARPAALSRPADSGRSLLSGMAADHRLGSRPSLGQKVGGWVFGRWGASPATTVTTSSSTLATAARAPSIASSEGRMSTDPDATPKRIKHRVAGINQSGPIPGFGPEFKRPLAPPVMRTLDEEALRMALGD